MGAIGRALRLAADRGSPYIRFCAAGEFRALAPNLKQVQSRVAARTRRRVEKPNGEDLVSMASSSRPVGARPGARPSGRVEAAAQPRAAGGEAGDEGGGGGRAGGPGAAVITRTRTQTRKPSMYRVLLLNDDYTPMEFVITVLRRYFNKNPDEAQRIMLHVHHHGVGECGVYTYEVAETKVTQVMDFARKHQHPLQCIMEKK
jgi:ATP-dependent Clp protease adaptor protein ClpS